MSDDTKITTGPDDGSVQPRQYMRKRRPELFSDSEPQTTYALPRELLGYHLDTLTSRKQEIEFEYFCRRLAEKEICPNLRPQTGPTGGGDSKTDSETVPVSSEIARTWVGVNPAAASERWAFAFSAKKAWAAKVRSDVKGIASTDRDYKRIICITNQYAPDRARSKLEDDLSRKYVVPVTVFDRSWIEKAILEHDRVELAVEALNLTGLQTATERRSGPRDVERQQELEQLEREISDAGRYEGAAYQLAEDCLKAALLTRGLEKARTEVEGCFIRATRIAEQVGHKQQQLRIAYNHAWTEYWWYEDALELNRLYSAIETAAATSNLAEDHEKVLNLWQLLATVVRQGDLTPEAAQLAERTERLRSALTVLAADATRPNNALAARTNLLLIDLYEALRSGNQEAVDDVWVQFSDVVERAKRLGDYPVERLANLMERLGDFVPDSAAFDRMFDGLVELLETHRSEGEGGSAFLARGFQKLKADKPYDAIRFFGKAQERLTKREYRRELVSALGGCSVAYEQVGLLWAARNCVLVAVERCLAFFYEDGQLVRPTMSTLLKLTTLEIRLGRLPCILSCIEVIGALTPLMRRDISQTLDEQKLAQDRCLGLLLLKADLDQLREMERLPATLDRLGLPHSQLALMYALGHEAALRAEGFIPESESSDSVADFFSSWLNAAVPDDLPDRPNLMSGELVEFKSRVLGCELLVMVNNNEVSIHLAESVLGAIEAFLATSLSGGAVPFRERATILIQPSSAVGTLPIRSRRDYEGEQVICIEHAAQSAPQTPDMRSSMAHWMIETVAEVMAHIAIVPDGEPHIRGIVEEERAFARVAQVSEVGIVTPNVFGQESRLHLRDWIVADAPSYPITRSEQWSGRTADPQTLRSEAARPASGTEFPPAELLEGLTRLTHRQQSVQSLIDVPLWNKAGWQATLYAHYESGHIPPLLGLGFHDIEVGCQIFSGLQKRLGRVDQRGELRVSIITGVDKANPHHYNVIIGTNVSAESVPDHNRFVVMVSRIHRMRPSSPYNLERFLEALKAGGRYLLAPVHFVDADTDPAIHAEVAILKTDLVVRPAWKIGPNDPDIVAIDANDDPVIPVGVSNPPVRAALKWKSELRRRGEKRTSSE